MLSFDIESPKPSEETTCMGRHPSSWMTELVEAVADCMEAYSPMGALGWRYHEDEELVELVVYPTPVELSTENMMGPL